MKIYLVKIWDLTESKKIVGDMPGISNVLNNLFFISVEYSKEIFAALKNSC